MDGKILLIGGGIAALAAYLWSKKNEDKKNTNNANKVTDDLSVSSTQAVALKTLMNVNNNFGFWSTDTIILDSKKIKLYNIMLSIIDWAAVQKDFSTLCNNELTLTNCLQKAFNTDIVQKALELAKSQKVVTKNAVKLQLTNTKDNTKTWVSFEPNTVLGALKKEEDFGAQGKVYTFINEFREDAYLSFSPYEIVGEAMSSIAKLINPIKK